jgi:cytoskeletal protein RodZ
MKKRILSLVVLVLILAGVTAYFWPRAHPEQALDGPKTPDVARAKVPDNAPQQDEIASTDQPATQTDDDAAPAAVSQPKAQPPAAGIPPLETAEEPVAEAASANEPAPVVLNNSQQAVLAMHRMIMAHASLRTPEETDPDSKGNKEIMQSMITKALAARSASQAAPHN